MFRTTRMLSLVWHMSSSSSVAVLGVLGAVLQITAITQVVAGVHDPLSIVAYAAGVGLGVVLGLFAGERLTPGMIGVTVITTEPCVARGLWELGWAATAQPGEGADGPVTVVFVAISRQDEARLHDAVHRMDSGAFVTTEELRARTASQVRPVPAGTASADADEELVVRPVLRGRPDCAPALSQTRLLHSVRLVTQDCQPLDPGRLWHSGLGKGRCKPRRHEGFL
jgi:uncharacterized protein YebE (UPF0316 family)